MGIRLLNKICPNCNNPFQTFLSIDKKTCGFKCSYEFKKKQTYLKKVRKCKMCGKEFIPKHTKSKGLYCSYKCSSFSRSKGFVIRKGYKILLLPNHPNASKQGYYAEHRYIVEQNIGRILNHNECVHHMNHKKQDNRIENLMLCESIGKHLPIFHPYSHVHRKPRKRNSTGQFAK